VYGVEAQFLDPVDIRIARTFRQDLDPTRTPRGGSWGSSSASRLYRKLFVLLPWRILSAKCFS